MNTGSFLFPMVILMLSDVIRFEAKCRHLYTTARGVYFLFLYKQWRIVRFKFRTGRRNKIPIRNRIRYLSEI